MNWYQIYRVAQSERLGQQDLFEEQPKKETPDIAFRRGFTTDGAHFVVFRIGDKFYSYKLSFPDWIAKVKVMSKHSPGKALSWVKGRASEVYEVAENGSIIRQIE